MYVGADDPAAGIEPVCGESGGENELASGNVGGREGPGDRRPAAGDGAAAEVAGGLHSLVDVVDELLHECGGLWSEGWPCSTVSRRPPLTYSSASATTSSAVRVLCMGLPAAAAVSLVVSGHRSAGRMPLMMAQ